MTTHGATVELISPNYKANKANTSKLDDKRQAGIVFLEDNLSIANLVYSSQFHAK